jgi:hypothetical protein
MTIINPKIASAFSQLGKADEKECTKAQARRMSGILIRVPVSKITLRTPRRSTISFSNCPAATASRSFHRRIWKPVIEKSAVSMPDTKAETAARRIRISSIETITVAVSNKGTQAIL